MTSRVKTALNIMNDFVLGGPVQLSLYGVTTIVEAVVVSMGYFTRVREALTICHQPEFNDGEDGDDDVNDGDILSQHIHCIGVVVGLFEENMGRSRCSCLKQMS